ncbi:MAG: hypothetical protein WC133_00015 [Candidatus Omnitrophota bacterium]
MKTLSVSTYAALRKRVGLNFFFIYIEGSSGRPDYPSNFNNSQDEETPRGA